MTAGSHLSRSYSSGIRKSGSLWVQRGRVTQRRCGSAQLPRAPVRAPRPAVAGTAERFTLPALLSAAPALDEVVLLRVEAAARQAVREVAVPVQAQWDGTADATRHTGRSHHITHKARHNAELRQWHAPLPARRVLCDRHHLVAGANGGVDFNWLACRRFGASAMQRRGAAHGVHKPCPSHLP